MSSSQSRRDVVSFAVMALAVVAGAQAVQYWAHVQSVERILTAQLMAYHQAGEGMYREIVLDELRAMDMDPGPEDFLTEERLSADEFAVELRYQWPWHVLVFSLDRPNVARTRTTILDR